MLQESHSTQCLDSKAECRRKQTQNSAGVVLIVQCMHGRPIAAHVATPEGHSAIASDVHAIKAHDDVIWPNLLGNRGCGPDAAHKDTLARGLQRIC